MLLSTPHPAVTKGEREERYIQGGRESLEMKGLRRGRLAWIDGQDREIEIKW